jgi:hypothetical protein
MIISVSADLPENLSATMAGLLKRCYVYRLQYIDILTIEKKWRLLA